MRQVAYAQAELARHCASTAVSVNMHHYLVMANVYRWRKGAPVEGVLKRVASEDLILMTSGGSDGLWPTTVAVRADGGYRLNGQKAFCSQSPIANVLSTMAQYDDPEEGRVVLMVGIPMSSPGVQILDNWDTLGMRASGSQGVALNDVFVSDQQVAMRRPWGQMDPALRNAGVHFAPPVAAVYHGVATAARDEAVRFVMSRNGADGRPMAEDPTVQRQVGLMDFKLRTSWWSVLGALDEIGEEPVLDDKTMGTVMLAKRHVVTEAVEVVDLAMSVVGGGAFFRTSPLEQAYRDVRAGEFHPLNPERTLIHAGRLALEQSVETIW